MRRRSLSPPRGGATHSRYSPPWTRTVSPGCATAAAWLIVRNGLSSAPSAVSDPVVATWSTDVMAGGSYPSRAPHPPHSAPCALVGEVLGDAAVGQHGREADREEAAAADVESRACRQDVA